MTDISKAAVDVAANVLRVTGEHYIASLLTSLRAALGEAEATLKSVLDREAAAYARHDAALAKAEAERDAANALLREAVSKIQSLYDGIAPLGEGRFAEADETVQAARAHLGAKP